MKYLFALLSFFLCSSVHAQKTAKYTTKILLIPLDDRPPCLQFTQKMGLIGDAEVIAPPIQLLGNFNTPGQSDQIINWLKKQDLKSYDAAVISLDMLSYGGLVASRVHQVDNKTALDRLEILNIIRERAPSLKIYGQSVIMRLAPTGNGENEYYRAKLAEWAEISVAKDEKSKVRTRELESQIPAEALVDYKESRARNLSVNLKAIDLVSSGVIDYLILSQDDAKPTGVHIADRERLIAETKRLNLTKKILVQPGADEISMLLLARALNEHFNYSPRIKAIYSSEALSRTTMPFEDRPLRQTVSYDIAAVGAREVEIAGQADLLLYVYASRFEPGRARSFSTEIERAVKSGKHVLVADIDPRGDVQGGDRDFSMALLHKNLFPKLFSYASWNTAGNTIGTTLPQGVIYALAMSKLYSSLPAVKSSSRLAEDWFTFHRVLDDYYYHTLVRAEVKKYISLNNWDANHLDAGAAKKVEQYCTTVLQKYFEQLCSVYASDKNISREFKPSNLTFNLPWRRTFEANINFDAPAARK
jgi:hypothetical protein